MGSNAGSDGGPISLPTGGGAQRGLGETFAPDLQTGTGNFTVPIAVPTGRNGFHPQLSLVYSTGQGNGPFGIGWSLSVPGVSRKTAKGVPRYRDATGDPGEWDTFLLSGSEELVPLSIKPPLLFRPRTEGLFAQVERVRGSRGDYWEVRSKDGLVSRYGTKLPEPPIDGWRDPATIHDPAEERRIFAWKLSQTADTFGNLITYDYLIDEHPGSSRRWVQSYLKQIRYVDYSDGSQTKFLVSVEFDYEPRNDAFSDHRAGFEIHTRLRCRAISITTHAGQDRTVRTYQLSYQQAPLNGVSLLHRVELAGSDGIDRLPPLEFGYTEFEPAHRHELRAVTGPDAPPASLARPDYALADLTGDGLPDVLEMNGTVRYWRNLGGGRFARPRFMREAPAGLALADPGVQLMDADGDGRTDVVVSREGLAGYYPIRHDARWDSFQPYRPGPTFSLEDPEVALVDLDGDGVADVVRAGSRLSCAFNDPEGRRWHELKWLSPGAVPGLPAISFADPRVKWADLSGDGLQDLVLLHNGSVQYWPNLGHGQWGPAVTMRRSPRFPWGYNPARILVGDVDGDGLADLVYVDDRKITLWINRSGFEWSDPIEIAGTPPVADMDAVRLVDVLGSGIAGVLWTADVASGFPRSNMYFLDLTGASKPYLLNRMDNHLGAVTLVEYRPSTADYLRDEAEPKTRWKTSLPFPVQVVARVEVIDAISRGKLTTEYRYHHGYWDGHEREFRGFGMVEQLDTEDFERFNEAGLHGEAAFERIDNRTRFSPPTSSKTWFHLGPVRDEVGDWDEIDYASEFWSEDPPGFERHSSVTGLLAGLEHRDRRDALRSLRGSIIRTELYALDGSPRQGRPYTVTESQYGVRQESPAATTDSRRRRVFFPFLIAQRTSQWERGDDPLTQIAFSDGYDPHGQPTNQTAVALPRRAARQQPVTGAVVGTLSGEDINETRVLATHTRTTYAAPDGNRNIYDRVAQVRSFELRQPPKVAEQDPDDLQQVLRDHWDAARKVHRDFNVFMAGWQPGDALQGAVRLIGHTLNHYDGSAFVGRQDGKVGPYGALTRSEALVFLTDEQDDAEDTLDRAYGERRPPYLDGAASLPDNSPAGFGANIGYRRKSASSEGYHDGYYADTARQQLDVQSPAAAQQRGLVIAKQDPLGNEVVIEPDPFWVLPAKVTDPAGLTTVAEYDPRTFLPATITDPNGHTTRYFYTPLGLLQKVVLARGTSANPEIEYTYDFSAYDRTRHTSSPQPISVRTRQRIRHAKDGGGDDAIESWEYSDGFGRSIQKRAQAEDLVFGTTGDDAGLLVGGQAVPGQEGGPAAGMRDLNRVAVSAWQSYDNKGRLCERYEPFFSTGWAFQPEDEAKRGSHSDLFYDPRGQLIRTVNPDGSEQRVVFGTPPAPDALDNLEAFLPSPWETYTYDSNHLAPISFDRGGAPLAGHAPVAHHYTPASTIADALGRVRCQIVRNGADPVKDWFITRSEYDIRGNLLSIRDALGREAFRHAYDLQDRPLRVASIDAGRRTSVLDSVGNLVEYRDSKGAVVLRQFDRLNRLIAVWARDVAAGDLTLREKLQYGDGGDPGQPAAERTANRARNRLSRLYRHYDEAGLLQFNRYDFKGNVTDKTRRVISDAALRSGWTADWAAVNALSALERASFQTNMTYDALNRPVEIVYPRQSAEPAGHRARLAPRYNRAGALERVELDGAPYVERIAYNAKGQRVLLVLGNGVMTRYAYDPATFRLVRLRSERAQQSTPPGDVWMVWQGHGQPLQDLTYNYDLAGNIVEIENRTPGCGLAGSLHGRDRLVRRFDCDPLYRLTKATGRACKSIGAPRPLADLPRCGAYAAPYQGGPPVPDQQNAPDLTEAYSEVYSYDPAGNLLTLGYQVDPGTGWKRRFGLGDEAPADWADAPNNRLTSLQQGAETYSYGYDPNGNMILRNVDRHYGWDHADRLREFRIQPAGAAKPSVEARYLYGADGLRVKKWIRKGGGGDGDSTVYIEGLFEQHRWKKQGQPAKRHDLLHVMDGNTRIALLRRGPAHEDDAGPPVQYDLDDHLGSSALVMDDSGGWINREEFFPYGETSFGSFARKRYRFTGKEQDEESGLIYHGARYYGPSLGQWMACDPAGAADGPNLYLYCLANPIRLFDSDGRQATTVASDASRKPVKTNAPERGITRQFLNERPDLLIPPGKSPTFDKLWSEIRDLPIVVHGSKRGDEDLIRRDAHAFYQPATATITILSTEFKARTHSTLFLMHIVHELEHVRQSSHLTSNLRYEREGSRYQLLDAIDVEASLTDHALLMTEDEYSLYRLSREAMAQSTQERVMAELIFTNRSAEEQDIIVRSRVEQFLRSVSEEYIQEAKEFHQFRSWERTLGRPNPPSIGPGDFPIPNEALPMKA